MADKFSIIKSAYISLADMREFDLDECRRIVKPVAEAYNAAVLYTALERNGEIFKKIELYTNENVNYGKQQVEFVGKTGDDTKAIFMWRCSEGFEWDNNDIDDLNFLSRAAYVLSGKIRLSSMANRFFFTDTATGLLNLNGLTRFAQRIISNGRADLYCAAYINIVGFNYINKKVGYKKGTQVIKLYGEKIGSLLDNDECIARIGGDDFVIFFKKSSEKTIIECLEGLSVSIAMANGSICFELSARAGLLRINSVSVQFEEIMNHISIAVKYAKNISHSNIVHYSQEVEKQVVKFKEYPQRFKAALQNNEFFVVYQPKVYTGNNTIYGGEALVRWKSEGAIIPPSEFVDILEKAHLICQLDFFVLEQTCKTLKKWIDSNITPVKISVNFSNEHLYEDNCISKIIQTVDRYGIEHSLIEIEMTETVDINEAHRLLEYVGSLHDNGFTVAIDDFGIGYSSLHLLQSVTVDVLKIDKSFVSEVEHDRDKRENVILRHIINMAAELGIEIVAEGVETGVQRQKLSEMNCHRIQGYIYDKPLEEDEFCKRIAAKNYVLN